VSEPLTWQQMRTWCGELLLNRTGEDVTTWNQRISEQNFTEKEALRDWLTALGVTGYAQNMLVMERFGYPDFMLASADELIDGQYVDRPQLRPILDAVLAACHSLGPVTIQARKTYVSLLSPRRTFAIVKATTRKRVDLGLRIDGQAPGGRLLDGSRLGSDSIKLRIPIAGMDELDGEALAYLERAYRANL